MVWKFPAIAAATVVVFTATAVLFGMAPDARAGCGSGVVDTGTAGQITNAAAELQLPPQAQTIGGDDRDRRIHAPEPRPRRQRQLVDAADQGRLIGSTPDHIKEIR